MKTTRNVTIILTALIILLTVFTVILGIVVNAIPSTITPFAIPLFGVVTLISIILSILQIRLRDRTETLSIQSKSFLQYRRRLLSKINDLWIEGVLERSLHGAAIIALGLSEQPAAVVDPWRMQVKQSGQPERALPVGTRITQVFDDANGELLILGQPGSGKTTLLLELARDLLKRAVRDDKIPVPVVFHLSSWAIKRLPLAEWFVEELYSEYQVPRSVGQSFIKDEQIWPLLDGLDEVAMPDRLLCVDAINTYRRDHSIVPMVVCSRQTEYMVLETRIALSRAVVILPLTLEQIDHYFQSAGDQLEVVRIALREDQQLQELITTPLMLNVLTLAYREKTAEDILTKSTLEVRQRQIFATYVEQMLQRGVEKRYRPQQTIHWLSWLAQQLVRNGQAEFYIERMQSDWLPNMRLRRIQQLTSSLIPAISAGILGGLIFEYIGGPIFGLLSGLIFGLFDGLIIGLSNEVWWNQMGKGSRTPLYQRMLNSLLIGLVVGLVAGLIAGVLLVRIGVPLNGVLFGLFFGLLVVQFFGGAAYIQHFTLRWLLWREGLIPWNYSHFLNYASEHFLLQKVDNGYIFVHRLFMEYFAFLDTTLLDSILFDTTLMEGTQANIQMTKGSAMITGEEGEIVLRVKNETKGLMGKIEIELLPSAEYTLISNRASISTLSPKSSQDVTFRLKMNVVRQVVINYKINGELKIPPLYVISLRDNPYSYGSPVDEAEFFGRQVELEQILQAVTKPIKQDVFIVGERRAGKTSLLFQLNKRLNIPFITVYILLTESQPRTDNVLNHVLGKIVQSFIERGILDSTWITHHFTYMDFTDKIYEILQAAQKNIPNINIILLLDEADFLLQIKEEDTFERMQKIEYKVDEHAQRILRAALQSPKTGSRLRAVVAGTTDLSTYVTQHSSPFFNHFRFIHLKPLSPEETYDLIVKTASIQGFSYSQNAIKRLSYLSGGQPYYCQALCYEAFGYALQQNHQFINDEEVSFAEEKIKEDLFDSFLSGYWLRATTKQRNFLASLARENVPSSLTKVEVECLLDWQIITRTQEEYCQVPEIQRTKIRVNTGESASDVPQQTDWVSDSPDSHEAARDCKS
jgi:AAA+ ATPase superfamily predicted ATPase